MVGPETLKASLRFDTKACGKAPQANPIHGESSLWDDIEDFPLTMVGIDLFLGAKVWSVLISADWNKPRHFHGSYIYIYM